MRLVTVLVISVIALRPAISEQAQTIRAWLDRFIAAALDAHTIAASPGQVEILFGLEPDKAIGRCAHELTLGPGHPAFVVAGFASLLGDDSDCEALYLGTVTLVVADAPDFMTLARDTITKATGADPRRTEPTPNITYHWQLAPGTAIELTAYGAPGDAGHYALTFAHAAAR